MSRIDKAIEMASQRKIKNVQFIEEPAETDVVRLESVLSHVESNQVKPLISSNPMLVTLNDSNGMAAEQYKKLRSAVIRKTQSTTSGNTILVTSSVAEEGKTLTSVNLAISIARIPEFSAILIDTDFRKPQIHQILDVDPQYGLVHYLRDGVPLEEILYKVGSGNLILIPAGERIEDPLSLLTSNRMKSLMRELKECDRNRYVLLDSPPTLPFADMKVLGELAENFLYVCREGHSKMDQIEDGLGMLSEYNLLGVVCNDVSMSMKMDYSYYGGTK